MPKRRRVQASNGTMGLFLGLRNNDYSPPKRVDVGVTCDGLKSCLLAHRRSCRWALGGYLTVS